MRKKKLYILLDPENEVPKHFIEKDNEELLRMVDGILLGGSTLNTDYSESYINIAKQLNLPLIGFPGGTNQIFTGLDQILFLHLLNKGNNNFVKSLAIDSCISIEEKKIIPLSTAYLLVGNNNMSTTAKVTKSTLFSKTTIETFKNAVRYATFSSLQNMYLEGGSGASEAIDDLWILEAKKLFPGIIWAGGGVKTPEDALKLWTAGANNVVVGTAYEKNQIDLSAFIKARDLH